MFYVRREVSVYLYVEISGESCLCTFILDVPREVGICVPSFGMSGERYLCMSGER